jgi:uncharacterized protein DUF6612
MTTHRAVRRAAAASAAALLTLVLTGCADDDPKAEDEPSGDTTTSEAATADEPEEGQTVDPAEFVDEVLGGMDDLTTAHMEMSMEGGPAEVAMEGDVDYTTTPPEMAMTMSGAMMGLGDDGRDLQVRMVDGTMYIQMPFGQADKWVKFEVGDEGGPLSEDLVDQMNPGAQLETMKDAVTEVTYVGEDETGDHYTLTVRSEAFRELQDQLGGTEGADLPSVLTYDLWTDAEGRVTRSEIAMGDLGTVTIELTDWDEDVDIEAPPESDVIEAPGGMMPGTMGS